MRFGRKNKEDQEPVDPEAISPQLGIKYKDMAVLSALTDNGADLSNPRHVLYFMYFTDEASARAAADSAAISGFESEAREPLPEFPDQWCVVSQRHDVVVDPEFVRTTGALFDALAAANNGEYDGWEASV